MKGKRSAVLLLFFLLISAGAEGVGETTSPPAEQDGRGKIILNVQFMKQKHMGCSRTCFAMVMHHYNPAITLEMVERDAPRAPDGGSRNSLMILLAERYGFTTRAFPGTIDDLLRLLQSGRPVIVAQYPSLTDIKSNHDRLVVGFDRNERILFVHDPSVGEGIPYPFDTFNALWASDAGGDDRYSAFLVTPGGAEKVPNRTVRVDGEEEDWQGTEPLSPDRADDTGSGDLQMNIKDLYCCRDSSHIYFKANFMKTPAPISSTIYFINILYHEHGASRWKKLHFQPSVAPWILGDDQSRVPLTRTQWKTGRVFEAGIGLENFKSFPGIVSVQAGVYDTGRKRSIDVSYPNALRIGE
ncbi:MAG: C39 family peptidase [Spirochaetes bacterium]|nr:C39 family peptidase [Spirochaetota bacterium]